VLRNALGDQLRLGELWRLDGVTLRPELIDGGEQRDAADADGGEADRELGRFGGRVVRVVGLGIRLFVCRVLGGGVLLGGGRRLAVVAAARRHQQQAGGQQCGAAEGAMSATAAADWCDLHLAPTPQVWVDQQV